MNSNKTIINYLTDFLDYSEIEKGLSSETQKNYHRFLEKFFKWLRENKLENLKPHELTNDHIWKYRLHLSRSINERSKVGLKKSTQNYYLIALRNLLSYFVEKDINSLPPEKIKLAKDKNNKEVNFLKIEQLEKLLLAPDTETIAGLRDRAILESLFSTGLRVAELVRLDRDQVKPRAGHSGFLEISIIGKGSKVRTVYFSDRAISWIKKYNDKRVDLDPALFINFTTAQKNSSDSRRLTVRSIENIVKKYIMIAGLPVMSSPHTLRHSYATDLLAQGVDLRLVQEFLGHSNISTTQIYTHVTNKQLSDIHQKFHSGKRLKN
ncbi:MAG: Tyrosine recombinase XerC [Parcubacteria group bacterium GW2011_GWE2_39_37]|nr:MAG: Tyrosine recombinase XerC [Parcubacteria group bacterium GW2011_GWE2_39_37]